MIAMLCSSTAHAAAAATGGSPILIYDGRQPPKPMTVSAAQETFLKKVILLRDQEYWKPASGLCGEDEFEITGVAQGSFTKASASQEAVAYKYCMLGDNFLLNGIAVFENGELISHIAYEGSAVQTIQALPDISGDGLSKILIATSATVQGETREGVSIIELLGKGVRTLGSAETHNEECATEHQNVTAYRLWAKPGVRPIFYSETYKRKCSGEDNWVKTGERKRIPPMKHRADYVILK